MTLNLDVRDGYIIYQTHLVKPKKIGDFPDTIYTYLCGSEYNPWWSNEIEYAYRVFDKEEAFIIAGGLGMEVGRVELRIIQERKGK